MCKSRLQTLFLIVLLLISGVNVANGFGPYEKCINPPVGMGGNCSSVSGGAAPVQCFFFQGTCNTTARALGACTSGVSWCPRANCDGVCAGTTWYPCSINHNTGC